MTEADMEMPRTRAPEEPAASDAPSPAVDISIIVPVATSEAALVAVVEGFGRELSRLGRSAEFIFVDDGVGEAIDEQLRDTAALGFPVKVVRFNHPFGDSVALSAGFDKADGAMIVTSPPYLQIEADEIGKLVAALDEGYDCVAAWRWPRVDPFLNRIQSQIFNFFTRLITGSRLHDLNCSLRAMRRRVLEDVSLYGDLFRFLPVIAQRQGFKVTEVKARHREEQGKTGFFGIGVYLRRVFDILTMFFLIKFTKRPLRFFGLPGMLFFGAGLAVNIYLTIDKILGEKIGDRPLLILGVLLMVMGIQTISLGLIGEIIIFTHARGLKEYKEEDFLA